MASVWSPGSSSLILVGYGRIVELSESPDTRIIKKKIIKNVIKCKRLERKKQVFFFVTDKIIIFLRVIKSFSSKKEKQKPKLIKNTEALKQQRYHCVAACHAVASL